MKTHPRSLRSLPPPFTTNCSLQLISCFAVNQKTTLGLEMRTPWRVHNLFFWHWFHWVKKVVEFGACRTFKQSQQGCAIRVRVLGHWHSHNYDSRSVQCTPNISAKSDNSELGFWCSCMQHNSCFAVNPKITIGLEMRTPWRVHSWFFSHRFHWVKKVVVFGTCRTVKQSQQGCAIRVRVLGHWHSHNYDSRSVQCTQKISAKSDNGKLGFCFLIFSNTNLVVSKAMFS